MLETKNLVKIYKPKKGVPVTALDNITLKLPKTGMVFLLGKSGSGKSTLLNVLGGLDNYNSGEIIIKGVSSKSFKQKHFDSYRNTYVGFIFQEYNVLDEFTVGANIALAIELQNRKVTDEQINEILKEVDLEGFGARKPNELSGGQKQRVAIARALVKSPEIILADEPTGALDSNTGRQIFDTLKKLSSSRLVIVVSHDRDFAENYADRIIELSDGRIISDVEVDNTAKASKDIQETLSFQDNIVEIPNGYQLTAEDRKSINDYIEKLKPDNFKISLNCKKSKLKKFKQTDISNIKISDGSGFKLIKSKLPLKSAFKIGASSLKYKKLRLVMTIILSCIAFGLFGISDTFGAYNHIKTCTNSLVDSKITSISVAKSKYIGRENAGYWKDYGYRISESELEEIRGGIGTKMYGVYQSDDNSLEFSSQINPESKLTETDYDIYMPIFSGGFSEINDKVIEDLGFKILAGNLPDGQKNEIAVNEYIFEVFKKAGYNDGEAFKNNGKSEKDAVYTEIKNYGDLIGKTITLNNVKYTVTAIIDTGFDIGRYESLTKKKDYQGKAEKVKDFVLYNEYNSYVAYSYSGIAMLGTGGLDKMISSRPVMTRISEGNISFEGSTEINKCYAFSENLARLSDIKSENIVWINGEKTSLGEKEIIVTTDAFMCGEKEETTIQNSIEMLKVNNNFSANQYIFSGEKNVHESGYEIVGVIDNTLNENKSKLWSTIVCSDSLFGKFTDGNDKIYSFAIGKMPQGKDAVKNAVTYCYNENSGVRHQIQNSVTYELDSVNNELKVLSKFFFWIGIGFAAFAALMLANFIATSISYKKQEIGILRAIGSRSNDIFRIFFAESFIISIINFVLSSIGVFAAITLLNNFFRQEIGILITILNFGPRQMLLLLAVSIAVAVISSFLPVKRIASKRPIDAIRDR